MKLRLLLGTSLSLAAFVAACSDTAASSSSGSTPVADSGTPSVTPVTMPEGWQEKAAGYMEKRTAEWFTTQPCAATCHTSFPYVFAKHAFGAAPTAKAEEARTKFFARVEEGAAAKPFYGSPGSAKETESWATEAVLNAASLSQSDLKGPEGAMSAKTQKAFERLWATQNAEGTWPWLEFGLYPWETGLDWGAAISVMAAKKAGQTSDPGYAKAVAYIKKRMTGSTVKLHDRIVVLWARSVEKDLMTDEEAKALTDEIAALQLEDGGFSVGSFGIGNKTVAASREGTADGYATALVTLALCSTEDGKKREDVRKALAWISQNQQEDGSWVGRSVNKEKAFNNALMTDAATAYAVLAVDSCN